MGISTDIEDLHRLSCSQNKHSYIDPASGYPCFTALALSARGACCGCGCRHCKDAFPDTGLAALKARGEPGPPPKPVMLNGSLEDVEDEVDILFWSGGKDSFLALRDYAKRGRKGAIVLLTTFSERSQIVAHQEVKVSVIEKQARAMGVVCVGVPLDGSVCGYKESITRAVDWIAGEGVEIRHAIFGDLHLEHIRAWRDGAFGEGEMREGVELAYPLWERDYGDMRRELREWGGVVRVCAVPSKEVVEGKVKVGDIFGEELCKNLPDGVDEFGEGGEFHSVVEVWAAGKGELPWGETVENRFSASKS